MSNAPNALYTTSTLMDMTMYMCRENNFVAPCTRLLKRRNLHAMSGGRFLQPLGRPTRDEMPKMWSRVLNDSVAELASRGKFADTITLATDDHLMARYTRKDNPEIKGGKRKSGTNFLRDV